MKIEREVARHASELALSRVKGLRLRPDGSIDATAWNGYCQAFMDNVVLPTLTENEVRAVLGVGLSRVATELVEIPVSRECDRLGAAGELSTTIRPFIDTRPSPSASTKILARSPAPSLALPPSQGTLSRGLIIRAEPLEAILRGLKTWEMRSGPTNIRGPIGLVQKGSKAVFGVAEIIDCLGPLSRSEMVANVHRHGITPERLARPETTVYRFAWVLSKVRPLRCAVPYVHKGGVRFVALDAAAVTIIDSQLRG